MSTERIVQMNAEGATFAQIAAACACTKQNVSAVLKRQRLAINVRPKNPQPISGASNVTLVGLFRSGLTMSEIATKIGVSKQRVHRRLRCMGVQASEGGIAARRELVLEERRRRFRLVFGCTGEQWRAYCDLGMRKPYRQQRRNATQRGIKWRLSFGQFSALWILSGLWDERGCADGQYVMARFGDRGDYCWENVEIVTSNQNSQLIRIREEVALF